MVEVRGVREQLGRLSVEDVAGVSACRPLLHPAREGWAVVAADRYLVAWEWRSSLRRVLQGHSSPVQAAVFSDNGSTLFSTDGVEFIAWSGASWREQVRAVRRIVGVGKQDERRDVWQMCCLGGGRLVATAEGPAKAVGRGTAHGHVMRVWDPSRGFKMLTEYSFKIDEAPPDRPVQLLSLPGTFDAMAVTPWVLVSFRHDSVLDITERNPILVDAGERGSSMMRRWHVQSSRGDEFVGATAGANNSVLVLSAAGELTTVDNLKGLEVKREALGPDGQLPYTSCHLSGTLVCVGALSGGVSVFSLGRTRNLSPLCRLAMDPYAQRNFVGRSTEQKHLADGVTVVPQWGGSAGCRGAGTPLPGVVALAVSDASKACVTLQEDLSVRVIDVSNRRVSAALWAHHGEVVCLAVAGTAFGPTTLVSGALDEVLVLWDVSRRHQGADASAGGGAGGVSSVSDRWGGSVGPRGGIHAIGGNGPHIVSSRTLQAGWQESLSLDPGKSVDLAALVHPSLSFCRKFRRKIADADISGDGKRADGIDGALAAGVGIGRLPGVRGAADEGSMSAVCLAVHPERTMVACGTVAGKLIVLALPSGTLVHERSAAKTGVMGLSFGPSGRWLVVRSGSGWVAVLDGKCGYRRACVVQDVAGGWAGGGDAAAAGEGYWPKWAHEVVCVGETLCASAGTHLNSSVVHVITRASLRSLAIYRVDAPSAQVDLLHRVELSGMPAHVTAHPSGHYVYILDRDEGRTSEGCARRPGAQDGEEATGRVELLHLMSGRFKGSFPLPRGTRTITIDPSGLFLASVQCVGGVEGQHTTGLRVQADSVGGNLSSVQGVAGQSVVSIWCCMSGDLRAEVGALPADVTELVFLPDCSALVAGVKGGQLLVLGMPRSLRAEAKRVLFGREEGMNGMTLQELWLARPIDMDLARTRRFNRSLADQAMAAKRLQAYLRRAIDPVGPCIHLARVLMPVLQRNAAVRFYKDFREGTYASRRLQAAARMVKVQPRYHQRYSAALDLERWVRVALSLRQYEESLSRRDRAAVAAMTAQGDPSGWGLWERASDFSLLAIPQLLQRSGQFEALQRTLSIAFLSRLVEARGVQAALVVLRRGVGAMRAAIKTRQSFSGRKMTDHELDVLQGIHEGVAALLDLVSTSSSALLGAYRRRTLVQSSLGAGGHEEGGRNVGVAQEIIKGSIGLRGWGGECLAGLAEERSVSDGRLLRLLRGVRKSVAHLIDRASFILDRSPSSEAYLITIGTPLEATRAREALNSRIGLQWQDVWARLRAKGMAHDEGGVLLTCSLQQMTDALRDPCTSVVTRKVAGLTSSFEGDLSSFAIDVLGCLAAIPVTAVAKDLQLKLQSVLRLGLALENTLAAGRLERELGTLLEAAPVRRSVMSDHVQVLSEGALPKEEAQRHLGYLLEGQLEERRSWRQYLRIELASGKSANVTASEWQVASQVRAGVCSWLKGLCKRSEKAARVSQPLLQVVRVDGDEDDAGSIWCTVAVSLDPKCAIASLMSDEDYSQAMCDLRSVVDGMVEEFSRSGAGFGSLNVRSLARTEGSLFLRFLSIIPGIEGGVVGVGQSSSGRANVWMDGARGDGSSLPLMPMSQGVNEQEMYAIFTSHVRQTLAAQHPEMEAHVVDAEVEARWRAHSYSIFEAEHLPRTPLFIPASVICIQFRLPGFGRIPSSQPSASGCQDTSAAEGWEEGVTVEIPAGDYRLRQLADAFNSLFRLECEMHGDRVGGPMVVTDGGGSQPGSHDSTVRILVELLGGTVLGTSVKVIGARQFRLHGSGQVMRALGLRPGPDGRISSLQTEPGGRWEVSAGTDVEGPWRMVEARARVAQQWIARHQLPEIIAATGLPPRCIRLLPPRDCEHDTHGTYVRTSVEILSSREVPLSIIRKSCDVLLRSFHSRCGVATGDALSRVLCFSACEGMVPPTSGRMWQDTGAFFVASAADVQGEALQLQRMVLPAIRQSLARQRIDFRWAGLPSPFCPDHRNPEGLGLARSLQYMEMQRLPGGKAYGNRGPRFFVAMLAELIDQIDPSHRTQISELRDVSRYWEMGSVGVQVGMGLLQSSNTDEAFVMLRDPNFMLSSGFKSLSLQAPTVKRCFSERSESAVQASKDLKRRIFSAVDVERTLRYSASFREHAVDVQETLNALAILRSRLLMCAELRAGRQPQDSQVNADSNLRQDAFELCERELRGRLRGVRNFLIEHLKLTNDQRVRSTVEDEVLRVLCQPPASNRSQGTGSAGEAAVAGVSESTAPSLFAARGVRLELQESMALVFSAVVSTATNYCEAAPNEQPLHRHIVCRERQEALLHRYVSRCADLSGRNVTLDRVSAEGEVQASCRNEVLCAMDDFVLGDASKKPPVLLVEGPRYHGKTATLAQWLARRHDSLVESGSDALGSNRDSRVAGQQAARTRQIVVFAFANAMSIEEVLVYLAIEVELQWHGIDAAVLPEALDGRYDALLSARTSQASVAACAQALRQALLQVAFAGGRVLLALDGLADDHIVLLSEVMRRCHTEVINSLQYRALALNATEAGQDVAEPAQAQGAEISGDGNEDDQVKLAREALESLRNSAREIEEKIRNSVTSAKTLQEWQQHETDRSELEQRLHALRGEKKQAAKHLDECLGRASVTQSNQAGIVGSLSFSAVQATASRTTYLGNVRAILTRALVPSGTQADKGTKTPKKGEQVITKATPAQILASLVQEGEVASRIQIPPLTLGEAQIVASVWQRRALGTCSRDVFRRLAAKAGGISPLYHVLVAHECSLLPSVSDAVLEALPDTVERLWTGALEGPQVPAKQKAKGKSKDLVQEELQIEPKFGMPRLALHSGQTVLREVVCAVLEASGTASTTVHGAALSVIKDRARDAMEREAFLPIPVVSRGGWVFATTNSAGETSADPSRSGDMLARGSLPPQCKVNGTPALLLDFDRESGIFETQGLGRGWSPGLILDLQPLFHDGPSTDALYERVEGLLWELDAMGLVRAERQGSGGGEPVFFAEHPALLAQI